MPSLFQVLCKPSSWCRIEVHYEEGFNYAKKKKNTGRDCSSGEFEPQLIKKHQTTLSGYIEEKIILAFGIFSDIKI